MYLPVFIYLFALKDVFSAYEIHDVELNHETYSNPINYSVFDPISLRNCHCTFNKVWDDGRCIDLKTSVELIMSFYPSMLIKKLQTAEVANVTIQDLECQVQETKFTVRNFAFNHDNTLFHIESGEIFTEYCMQHVFDSKKNIVAEAAVCLQPVNVPSCCSPLQYLDKVTLQCLNKKSATPFNPPVRLGTNDVIDNAHILPFDQNIPKCSNHERFSTLMLDKEGFAILQYQNAEVLLFQWDKDLERSLPQMRYSSEFCIGHLDASDDNQYMAVTWEEWVPISCEENPENGCDKIMYWVLLPLLIISTVFLFIIFILHIFMAELRKSLGGKITLCHVTSLLAAFCVLLVLHIPQDFNCSIYGPLVQITFLCAFFWLNVMCFDLWWKLRCRNPSGESLHSSQKRFWHYSIYAWGCPLLISTFTIIVDNISSLDDIDWFVKPGFGKKSCWFADRTASLIYYFGIVGVLMVGNFIFFLWVCIILIKANCTYNKVLKNNPRNSERSWIYLRVFSVMGVTWICEFISWQEGTCEHWILTDVINSLRGFVLFVIFFGNRKSFQKIRIRFSTLNSDLHTRVIRSVHSLRKLSIRTSSTFETGLDSRRSSETTTELSNRKHDKPDNEEIG